MSGEWCVVCFLKYTFAECGVVWEVDARGCFASEYEVVDEVETWME